LTQKPQSSDEWRCKRRANRHSSCIDVVVVVIIIVVVIGLVESAHDADDFGSGRGAVADVGRVPVLACKSSIERRRLSLA
jgi:hypothetical protein